MKVNEGRWAAQRNLILGRKLRISSRKTWRVSSQSEAKVKEVFMRALTALF